MTSTTVIGTFSVYNISVDNKSTSKPSCITCYFQSNFNAKGCNITVNNTKSLTSTSFTTNITGNDGLSATICMDNLMPTEGYYNVCATDLFKSSNYSYRSNCAKFLPSVYLRGKSAGILVY